MSSAATLLTRFDRLSLRERAFVCAAVLAGVIALWDVTLMQPLRNTKSALTQELTSYSNKVGSVDDADAADPRRAALTRAAELQTQTQAVDAQLTSTAAGFVPAQRMVEVIHDVLTRQRGLKLITLRNLPVTSLVPPTDPTAPGANPAITTPATNTNLGTAPYVHPIELIIEGEYTDVLTYVAALEALPWRFRWKTLDLTTKHYPVNRVRIELSTLSMDKTWLGVGP